MRSKGSNAHRSSVFFKRLVEGKPISIGDVADALGTDAKALIGMTSLCLRYADRKHKVMEPDLTLIIKDGMESEAEALNQDLRRFISVNYGAENIDFFLYRVGLHFSVIPLMNTPRHIKMRISRFHTGLRIRKRNEEKRLNFAL